MRSCIRSLVVVAGVLSLGVVACDGADSDTDNDTDKRDGDSSEQDLGSVPGSALGVRGSQLWQQYVKEASAGVAFQRGCAPVRVPATDRDGKIRKAPLGVIVLFHGYTACPQQFMNFDRALGGRTESVGMAAQLSKAGYEVLLPVLPGHGRMPIKNPKWAPGTSIKDVWPVIDQTAMVPAPLSVDDQLANSPYTELVRKMNAIMENATTQNRVVGGISVGAVLATHATLEAKKDKPYTRALIAAPFYQAGDAQLNIARDAARALATTADLVQDASLKKLIEAPLASWKLDPLILTKLVQTRIWEKLGEMPLGWGAECELTERKLGADGLPDGSGRAGICQFQAKNLAGALLYGKLVQDQASKLRDGATKFQITGVVGDPVVSNREIVNVAAKLRSVVGDGRSALCFYENANHSMFSWHDSSSNNQDKAWIPPLEKTALGFLTANGTSFAVSGSGVTDASAGGNVAVCSVK